MPTLDPAEDLRFNVHAIACKSTLIMHTLDGASSLDSGTTVLPTAVVDALMHLANEIHDQAWKVQDRFDDYVIAHEASDAQAAG